MAFGTTIFADANEFWTDTAAFEAAITQWKADGLSGVILTSGALGRFLALLDVSDSVGFDVYGMAAEQLDATWWDPSIAATIANARAAIYPLVDALAVHPSLKGYYLFDEPTAADIGKLQLAVQAFGERDPSRPTFAVLIGTDRVGPIQTAVGFPRFVIDVYPAGLIDYNPLTPNAEMSFTLDGFGYPALTFRQYIRDVLSDAAVDQQVTPFWLICQTHDAASVGLRRPTVPEIRRQFWEGIGEGADMISWFIWHDRGGEWVGLQSLPAEYAEIKALNLRVQPFSQLLQDAAKAADEFTASGSHYASTLKTPSAAGARTLLVVCNTTAQPASVTITRTAGNTGTLRELEAGNVVAPGAAVSLNPGDGRIYEWTAAGAGTQPAPHIGVPQNVITDYTQTVESWKAGFVFNPESANYNPTIGPPAGSDEVTLTSGGDLMAAILAAPAAGRVIWLNGGTYASNVGIDPITGLMPWHIHIKATPGTTPIITGRLRLIPLEEARNYNSPGSIGPDGWSSMVAFNYDTATDKPGSPGVKLKGREVITTYYLRDWYFKGITFDGLSQTTANCSLSTCRDIVWDDCVFQGIIRPADLTLHSGHVNGNSTLNNIWFRNCRFRGNFNAVGAVPRLLYYLDGAIIAGDINCTFDGSVTAGQNTLQITNDDFTRNYNGNTILELSEQRLAQYNISYGASLGSVATHVQYTGRENMVMRAVLRGGETMTESLMYLDSRPQLSDNAPAPHIVYEMTGNVAKLNDLPSVGGAFYVAITAGIAYQIPDTFDAKIGRTIVKDNIVRVGGFTRWLNEAAQASLRVGPNTITGNATSGTIPPAPAGGGGGGAGAVVQLVFSTQPVGAAAAASLATQPIVQALDASGNVVATYTEDVTISLGVNPGGGTLSGTATVAAVAGVATFTGLAINNAGGGYRLQADDGTFAVISNPFSMTGGPLAPPAGAGNITFVAGSTGTAGNAGGGTLTLTPGAPFEANDLIVIAFYREATVDPSSVPSGFAEITAARFTMQAGAWQTRVYTKTATASEPASYALTWANGSPWRTGAVFGLRGAKLADLVDVVGVGTAASGVTATMPSVVTTVENAMLLAVYTNGAGTPTWTPPTGFTERVDFTQIAASMLEQAAAGASGAKVATATQSSSTNGVLIALKPEPVGVAVVPKRRGRRPQLALAGAGRLW